MRSSSSVYSKHDLFRDQRSFPASFSGQLSSNIENIESFIPKQLSEIHPFEYVEEDRISDSNTAQNDFQEFLDNTSNQQTQDILFKKPKSQIISNSKAQLQFKYPQSPKNKFKASFSNCASTPEKKKQNQVEFKTEQRKGTGIEYFDNVPKVQMIQLKKILKNSTNQIKEIIRNHKETFNLSGIKQFDKKLEQKLLVQKKYRKQFFRYAKIESYNKESLSFRDYEAEMKLFLTQKLAFLEEKVFTLVKAEKKFQSPAIHVKSNAIKSANHFMKKQTFHVSETFKTMQLRKKTHKENIKTNGTQSKSKGKSREKTLLGDIKTIFSFKPQTKDELLFSRKNTLKAQPLGAKLEQILTVQIKQPQDRTKSKAGQTMRNYVREKNVRLVRQKISDYQESKKILLKMLSDRFGGTFQNSALEWQQEQRSEGSSKCPLLKNIMSVRIDTSHLKYKCEEINTKRLKGLDLIPQNCEVLYLMKNNFSKNVTFESQKQKCMRILSQNGRKRSINLQNKPEQKSVNRVDRDFSPANPRKMTTSVMIPNNHTPGYQEKYLYKDYDRANSQMSQQLKKKNEKGPMYYSINLNNTGRGENAAYVQLKPKTNNKQQLYREAYQQLKPEGPIEIQEFYQRGIIQKCEQYVYEQLRNNKKKPFSRSYSQLKRQSHLNSQIKRQSHQKVEKNENCIFELQDDELTDPQDPNQLQRDIEHKMRINRIMSSWSQPKMDLMEKSIDSEIENQNIKRILQLGQYKKIGQSNGQTYTQKQKSFDKPKYKQQKPDSQLKQYIDQCQGSQQNFAKDGKQIFNLSTTTAQKVYQQLYKNYSFTDKNTHKPLRPKLSQSLLNTNQKNFDVKMELKRAISEDQNEDDEEEKTGESQQRLAMFRIPSNDHQSQSKTASLQQQVPPSQSNDSHQSIQTIKTLPVQSQPSLQQKPLSKDSLESQKNERRSNRSLQIQKNTNEKIDQPPVRQLGKDSTGLNAGAINKKPPKEKKEDGKTNIFNQKKPELQKNLFQTNQNNPSKSLFGQPSNLFNKNSQPNANSNVFAQGIHFGASQSNPPQYPSFSPPQFASFGPSELKPFQANKPQSTFSNFGSPGQQNNSIQQINQQLGQQFASSMGGFESFGPAAFQNPGLNNLGGNGSNGNNQQQNSSSTNPFTIMQQKNVFGTMMHQPGVTQAQMQARK